MGNEEIVYFYKSVPITLIGRTDRGRDFADHIASEFISMLLDRKAKKFLFCDLTFRDYDVEPDQMPDFVNAICTVAPNGIADKKCLQYLNASILYGFNIGADEYVKVLARQIRDEYDKYMKSKESYRLEIEADFRREEQKKILEKYSELIDKNVNKRMEKRDAKIKAKQDRKKGV